MVNLTTASVIDRSPHLFLSLSQVEALMDLTHPNIVQLHEYYRDPGDDGALFLVEEFCGGGTLEDRMERRGRRGMAADEARHAAHHPPVSFATSFLVPVTL